MLKNKYTLEDISIEPNYGSSWERTIKNIDVDFILIVDNLEDEGISVNLEQARFIMDSLKVVVDYYDTLKQLKN